MAAYYNEHDPYAAAWLRNLIDAGHIAPGVVDERDVRDIEPSELDGYEQCHFFAGIGVWSHALRRAGWPDDRPVWTGSCPCQPFSGAGRRGGVADERHLWPAWVRLIAERRPPVVLGEQVASGDGLGWLDLVSADLEAAGYAVGATDLCAAGFGGAHVRQRLYFVGLADAAGERWNGSENSPQQTRRDRAQNGGAVCGLADAHDAGLAERPRATERRGTVRDEGEVARPYRARDKPLGDAQWIECRDGRRRPVEPGTLPLAHEAPARVGRLRAYGNALDAETAARFVGAVIECL